MFKPRRDLLGMGYGVLYLARHMKRLLNRLDLLYQCKTIWWRTHRENLKNGGKTWWLGEPFVHCVQEGQSEPAWGLLLVTPVWLLSPKKRLQCCFYVIFFNVTIPTSSDKTAAMAASTSISSAAAIGYNFSLEQLLLAFLLPYQWRNMSGYCILVELS